MKYSQMSWGKSRKTLENKKTFLVEQQCDLQCVKTVMYDNFHSTLLFWSVFANIMLQKMPSVIREVLIMEMFCAIKILKTSWLPRRSSFISGFNIIIFLSISIVKDGNRIEIVIFLYICFSRLLCYLHITTILPAT